MQQLPEEYRTTGSIYNKQQWKRVRMMKLKRTPLCEVCNNPAEHVHHIRPVKEDISLAYDLNNLQSLCISCHSKLEADRTIRKQRS